mmetsp:Transcript_4306/g.13984  ORF Transcript_4306/g.13984 Transcript_4306/m.13984 type:complete len:240 (+) Transcript_4306:1568-2287(+)
MWRMTREASSLRWIMPWSTTNAMSSVAADRESELVSVDRSVPIVAVVGRETATACGEVMVVSGGGRSCAWPESSTSSAPLGASSTTATTTSSSSSGRGTVPPSPPSANSHRPTPPPLPSRTPVVITRSRLTDTTTCACSCGIGSDASAAGSSLCPSLPHLRHSVLVVSGKYIVLVMWLELVDRKAVQGVAGGESLVSSSLASAAWGGLAGGAFSLTSSCSASSRTEHTSCASCCCPRTN